MKSSTFGTGLSPLVLRSFDTCLLIIYTFIYFFCLIHQIPSKCLFSLLASLDRPSPDSLEVLDLVRAEKPLKPMVRKLFDTLRTFAFVVVAVIVFRNL